MSVDSRITTMKFDNAQFERGAAQTMSTLDKLKKLLSFENSSQGLRDVQNAANGFNLNPMQNSIQGISKAWMAMATVAITALANIANRAVDAGLKLAKSFTVDPIKAGLKEYETNLNSIQTILANTKGEGLKDVNAALSELNDYSDKTIYNFSEMARNIGTFTAAGVKLDPSVEAIKGIANLAALSGSNAQQASTAMYQLSQALAAGKVTLMDWNSVVNAGMGGKVFQTAIKQTAEASGVAVDSIIKEAGSFRASISKGWITDDILTDTLRTFTGDMTREQLKAMGYNDKLIDGILKRAKTATEAATKVKTFTGLIQTLEETAGSGWARSWQLIFGDFKQAREMWTSASDFLGGFITRSAEARNKILGDWNKLGGRVVAIEAIKNVFKGLSGVITPIRDAFRDIFPAMTGKRLFEITKSIRDLTEGLKVSKPVSDALKRTFQGIFAVLDIGAEIIKGVLSGFFNTFGIMNNGTSGVLELTASIGDMLVALRDWLQSGNKIGAFFDKIQTARANVLEPVLVLFNNIADAVASLISGGFDAFVDSLAASFSAIEPIVRAIGENLSNTFNSVKSAVSSIGLDGIFTGFKQDASDVAGSLGFINVAFGKTADATDKVESGVTKVTDAFRAVGRFIAGFGQGVSNAFGTIKDKLSNFFEGLGIEDTLAVVNTGFFIALYVAFRKFLGKMGGVIDELKNVFGSASGVLDQVTSNLKSMQTEVRANAIMKIAIALGLLAASLLVLSTLDNDELARGLAAVAALLTVLVGSLIALERGVGGMLGTASKLVVLSAAMIGMGIAIAAMAAAVTILARLDTKELARGIGAVAAILAVVIAAAGAMQAVGGAQLMAAAAAGLLILSAALLALAGALKLYASLDLKMLAEGGAKAAAALIAIGIGMRAMPKNMLAQSAALFIVAASLTALAGALKLMGGMSVEEIGKSLGVLAYSLGLIAISLNLMTGATKGALAMLIFAGALAILVPMLILMSKLSMKELAIGLAGLAGVFIILGAAAYALAPLAPIIMGLAGGIALLALSVALVGGGLLAFSIGLATLAASGAAGVAVLTAAIISIAQLFPLLMQQFGLGIRALAVVISKSGPELVAAISTLLGSLIKAIIQNIPKIGKLIRKLVSEILRILVDAIPKMVIAGVNIIIGLMEGIRDNIGRLAKTAREMIEAWMGAMSKQIPKLADSALEFIVEFINGIADAIEDNTAALILAGGNLATAVIQGIVKGLGKGAGEVVAAAKNVAKGALDGAMKFLGVASPSKEFEKLGIYVDQGFAKGLIGGLPEVKDSLDKMRTLISDSIEGSKSEIDEQKKNLAELKKNPSKNADEIKKATKAISQAEKQYARSKDAREKYNKLLKEEREELYSLAKEYGKIEKRLEKPTEKLKAAQQEQKDRIENITQQYNRLPNIGQLVSDYKQAEADAVRAKADADKAEIDLVARALPQIEKRTSVAKYKELLTKQAADTEEFLASLGQLRDMGLDDETYKKLLDEGVDILPFVRELLSGGSAAIEQIDALTDSVGSAASRLANLTNPASTATAAAQSDPMKAYTDQLTAEAMANETFLASLAKLRTMGLDDASYEKFLEEGVSIQPFIDSLIAGGPTAVEEIDRLTANLKTSAASLGTQAGAQLHQAGIDSLKGLVSGIQKEKNKVVDEMEDIARRMVKAVRKELKMKSPSQIMEEVGKLTDQGLSRGLDRHARLVDKSAEGVATGAVDTIKSTLEKVSASVNTSMSTDPVIRPVLDLTQMTRDVSSMNKMLDKQMVAEASYGQAASISSEEAARIAAKIEATSATEPSQVIEFSQYNYSPKALSPGEIYRDTKNILSLAKEALK